MTKNELIVVVMNDGSVCRMAKKALNLFLSHDRVTKFMRSDGWAVVGEHPLRNMNKSEEFNGVERRVVL
jgi:hypothetical protein